MPGNTKDKGHIRLLAVMLVCIMLMPILAGCGSKKGVEPSKVHGIDDLPGASIGVQIGTTGDLYASDYEAPENGGSRVERYNKGADAVQALKQGKLDCIIIDQAPAEAFAAINSDISILEESFVVEDYAICIAKGKDTLREQINDAISQLEADGTLEKINMNYIGDETKGMYPYVSTNTDYSNGTLTIATNAEFEPYEYIESGEIIGIDIDMAQAICDILHMDLKIENIAFDAIINSVQSGLADVGVSGMTVTEDRLKSIDFTRPYTTATQVIIVRNGNADSGISFSEKIENNFIKEDRWKNITTGLGNTLLISLGAVIIGLLLGFIIAIGRSTCDKTGKCRLLNAILKLYLTVIRGTPSMIQLLIIYYVIFASSNINKVTVAIIAFGLNSSAYIAEIVRSGITSIDNGQFEAGRSLGFSYAKTMIYFILPQAIRNILPALGNEFIVLIKETSISGYIGIMDLTRGGDLIRSRTYEAFLPLIAVALVYLVIVVILSWLVGKLERRLSNAKH